MRKGSSLYVWFLISALIPFLGPLMAALYRRETEEALRVCPGCRAVVRHYDSMCMRCGTDLSYPRALACARGRPSARALS
jgi:predicted amidophosphoribosyltransferase